VVVAVVVAVAVSCVLSASGVVWSGGWVDVGVCAWRCAAVVVDWIVNCGMTVGWRWSVGGLDVGVGVGVVSIAAGRVWGVGVGSWGVWSIFAIVVVVVAVYLVVQWFPLFSSSLVPSGLWVDPAIFSFHLLTQCPVG
jgi:hypothetical protein